MIFVEWERVGAEKSSLKLENICNNNNNNNSNISYIFSRGFRNICSLDYDDDDDYLFSFYFLFIIFFFWTKLLFKRKKKKFS